MQFEINNIEEEILYTIYQYDKAESFYLIKKKIL